MVTSSPAPQAPALPQPRPQGPQRVVVPANEEWAAAYPFASHFLNVGTQAAPLWLHYVDEGPRDAPVVVMLHGNPTWSFYWRALILALRGELRVIVPDHIGCGLSDRPQAWPHRLSDHIDNVGKLLDTLGVQRFHLAVHDWGGAIGMGVATERPQAVDAILLTNTAAYPSKDIPLSIASVRIPGFGPFAVLQLNAFAGVAAVRASKRGLSRQAKAGLLAPYSNPHDRLATLRFVQDIPMAPSHPSWARLARIEERLPLLKDKRIALAWGDADFCFTPKFRARFSEIFPCAAVHAWPEVGHYVMEDAPERVIPIARALFGLPATQAARRDAA